MLLSKEIIEETVAYKKRQPYIIFIFFVLIILPFVFSIINFTNLKKCQANESNGCPSLDTAEPQQNNYLNN